jgi:serine/threonine protein kinase
METKIIGQGSYGCVYKPSLHCDDISKKDFNYTDYISKFMKTNNAIQELEQYLIIGKLDKNDEYHLGRPVLCKPDVSDLKHNLANCEAINLTDFSENPDNYSLLLSKYGGKDLHYFFRYSLSSFLSRNKQMKVDKILIQIHNLIMGLQFFKQHGLVHYDIKPQNILFNSKQMEMRYIDFGLMTFKNKIINESKNSDNWLGIYHWSYPFDCGMMNQTSFTHYKNLSTSEKQTFKNKFAEIIINETQPLHNDHISIKSPAGFKVVFTYLNPSYKIPDKTTQYSYVDEFFNGLNDMIEDGKSYEHILNKIIDSIDIYSLGFTLQFIVNSLFKKYAFSVEHYTLLTSFFSKMYDFNPNTRITDIETLLDEYENILLLMGVLSRLRKKFVNHRLVDNSPLPIVISNIRETAVKSLTHREEENAYLDPEPLIICPAGKEMNPNTRKCVKKCKNGYIRNELFKCTKRLRKLNKMNKMNKMKKYKSAKRYYYGKNVHPKTRRSI